MPIFSFKKDGNVRAIAKEVVVRTSAMGENAAKIVSAIIAVTVVAAKSAQKIVKVLTRTHTHGPAYRAIQYILLASSRG